ncbi:hypothetical protein [Thermosulfidibacter takaii]|uniref:hypothetical protein n=1 Tax=Thermosulfidibacter takaii TaxID=412593 RepID=UPI0008382F8D|nr:hypothetical protein [Thermosulfidibacter takaii]
MWCKNPFKKGGWWGEDKGWYNSGYCNFTYWYTEKTKGAYRNVNFVHPFVELDKPNRFNQLAMFHGSLPNPGFPPLSFYPES